MMTPRDNYINFLQGKPFEWLPNFNDRKHFMPAAIPENVARGLVIQQEPFPEENYGGKDMFGVEWFYEPEVCGSMDREPLFSDPDDLLDWENHLEFPNLDTIDWEKCAEENRDYLNTDLMLTCFVYTGFFERVISLVGFEDAAIALIDEDMQEAVKRLFDRLVDYHVDFMSRMKHWFNVEYFELHDDWGTQRGPTFSPETHTEMILPYVKKVVDGAHALGLIVEQHSCGKIEEIIPNVIASGVDTWRGQEINDKAELVRKYGDQFLFGADVFVDSDADDDELRAAVEKALREYSGKKVWFMQPLNLPPERRVRCNELLRELYGRV